VQFRKIQRLIGKITALFSHTHMGCYINNSTAAALTAITVRGTDNFSENIMVVLWQQLFEYQFSNKIFVVKMH